MLGLPIIFVYQAMSELVEIPLTIAVVNTFKTWSHQNDFMQHIQARFDSAPNKLVIKDKKYIFDITFQPDINDTVSGIIVVCEPNEPAQKAMLTNLLLENIDIPAFLMIMQFEKMFKDDSNFQDLEALSKFFLHTNIFGISVSEPSFDIFPLDDTLKKIANACQKYNKKLKY